MKNTIILVPTIIISTVFGISNPVKAAGLDLGDLVEIGKELAEFFGGEEEEPSLTANNDPCYLNFNLTGMKGVYGNGTFSKENFSINDFWKGNIKIVGKEGFVKNDNLQISGNIQHKTDFCDQKSNNPGSPISFLLNLDLNNENTAQKIGEDGKITIKDLQLPKPGNHNPHKDVLISVVLDSIIFDDKEEIGLYNITIKAAHHVPEPITGLIFAAGLGGVALKRAKDKSKKS